MSEWRKYFLETQGKCSYSGARRRRMARCRIDITLAGDKWEVGRGGVEGVGRMDS